MTRTKQMLYNIKWFFQKIFRKNHISDIEIWDCYQHLAKFILPRIKALRTQDFLCYPNDVNSISCSRTVAKDDDEYDQQQIADWKKNLDEMIFAFEYALYGDASDKDQRDFYLKNFSEDPYEKFNRDFEAGTLDFKNDNVNYEIVNQAHQRALKGFELFGKYFLYLWD